MYENENTKNRTICRVESFMPKHSRVSQTCHSWGENFIVCSLLKKSIVSYYAFTSENRVAWATSHVNDFTEWTPYDIAIIVTIYFHNTVACYRNLWEVRSYSISDNGKIYWKH